MRARRSVIGNAALCLALAGAACSDAPEARPHAVTGSDAAPGSAAARSNWVATQLPPAATVAAKGLVAPASLPAAPAAGPEGGYAFVGKWSHGGRTFAYLQRGSQPVLTISEPGPLDAQYAVQSMDAHRLVLVHLGQGTRQVIDLDAEPKAAPGRASPVAADPQLPPPAQAPSSEAAMPED